MPFLAQRGKYHHVGEEVEDGDDGLHASPRPLASDYKRQKWMLISAYVAQSVVMFALGVLAGRWYQAHTPLGTYETGFATEGGIRKSNGVLSSCLRAKFGWKCPRE